MNKNALIIFAKNPVPGTVKTRLAAGTSIQFALSFYKICLNYFKKLAVELTNAAIADVYFFYNEIPKADKNIRVQRGGDLGEKMFNAFHELFDAGYKNICIIGTDIPDINKSLLKEAFQHLNDNDYVIGPAVDGGYYLLGMKEQTPTLFSNINWSTNTVFVETLQKLQSVKIKISSIMIDIDTSDELHKWLKTSGGNSELKSETRILIEKFEV